MLIKKTYKFYASHRNRDMQKTKCFSVHGHRYGVTLIFNVQRDTLKRDITVPFEAYEYIETYFKQKWDHAHMIDKDDPLYPTLSDPELGMRLVVLERIPSVENICYEVFGDIVDLGYTGLVQLEIQETDTSTVIYNVQDFQKDQDEYLMPPHVCDFSTQKQECEVCGKTRYIWASEQRALRRKTNEQPDTTDSGSGDG